MVDALPLALQVWDMLNFDQWEVEQAAETVLAQDLVEEKDCFNGQFDR